MKPATHNALKLRSIAEPKNQLLISQLLTQQLDGMPLRIRTLGKTSVQLDGKEIDWLASHRRGLALVLYLALDRKGTRNRVMALLWPDSPSKQARHSLNQLVYSLRKKLGDDVITTAGDELQLNGDVEVDAWTFARAVEQQRYAEAVGLYRGGFLSDVAIDDSPALEHWADQHRARITRLHRTARRALLEQLAADDAVSVAREWAELEPHDDEAQHRCIALLLQTGQRNAALKHYAAYERLLAADGLTPLDETRALIDQLRGTPPVQAAATGADSRLPVTDLTYHEEAHLPWFGRLFSDLKRRHVIRVLAVYALLLWGVVEVVDSVVSASAARGLLASGLLLSPFIVVLAWYFDITPHGIRRTRPR